MLSSHWTSGVTGSPIGRSDGELHRDGDLRQLSDHVDTGLVQCTASDPSPPVVRHPVCRVDCRICLCSLSLCKHQQCSIISIALSTYNEDALQYN